jgi:60 kDa SS-A/Ro ribonucleoprotein
VRSNFLARIMRMMYRLLTMSRYGQHANALQAPQTERSRADQVRNNAGGYVFALDCWKRLDRWLILGAEGGTYYASERRLVKDNVQSLHECIAADGIRTVKRIVEVSDAGRAPKNDPAIFALAVCASAKDPATRQAALSALPKVCRIGTHLFHFLADIKTQRHWSRSLRRAVASWYTNRTSDRLALQLAKYQQRDGWSHKDALRLSHAKPQNKSQDAMFRWVTTGGTGVGLESRKHSHRLVDGRHGATKSYVGAPYSELPELIQAFDEMMLPSGIEPKRAIELIRRHRMPHECVRNELKSRPDIWEALLDGMGPEALLRNVNKMTSIGLFTPMSSATRLATERLTDKSRLFEARTHPLKVLVAMRTYTGGHGLKGSLTWQPAREIVDAMDEAFYSCFEAIEPTGARTMLALDVSGSMASCLVGGMPITPREASAAMAMVTARTEKYWHAMAFGHRFQALSISPRQRLDDVVRTVTDLPFQTTDCSLPIRYAQHENIDVDAFVVYTDNETFHGAIHPYQALAEYRHKRGVNAKLIVVGMVSNKFTIADPNDDGMMDVVGFDTATPGLMADFIADRQFTRKEAAEE